MKTDFSKVGIEELLNLFVRLSIEQEEAIYVANTSGFNRLGDTLYEIINEIKRRPDDRGQSMLKLFGHPNTQVRFNAATSVSGLFTNEARRAIQSIADSKSDLMASDARMYLRTLDAWIRKQES